MRSREPRFLAIMLPALRPTALETIPNPLKSQPQIGRMRLARVMHLTEQIDARREATMRSLAILAAAAVMVASPAIASAAPPCPPEVKEAKAC